MSTTTFTILVRDMQAAISCLGIFISVWGFTQHAGCLWKVLTSKVLAPNDIHCIRHSYVAMMCIAGVVLATARMNTIGILPFGGTSSGLMYIAGMLILVVSIGVAVWARSRSHESLALVYTVSIPNVPTLSRILAALLIVTLAFVGVGLLNVGQ